MNSSLIIRKIRRIFLATTFTLVIAGCGNDYHAGSLPQTPSLPSEVHAGVPIEPSKSPSTPNPLQSPTVSSTATIPSSANLRAGDITPTEEISITPLVENLLFGETPTEDIPTECQSGFMNFTSLPKGRYLIYSVWGDELFAISMDGKTNRQLTICKDGDLLVPFGKWVSLYEGDGHSHFVNFATGQRIDSIQVGNCGISSATSDLTWMTMICDGSIFLLNSQTMETLQLAKFEGEHEGDFNVLSTPIWSPDGKWIAYLNDYAHLCNANGPTKCGLYLIDMSCLAKSVPCAGKTIGPLTGNLFLQGRTIAWSPDSHKIALLSRQKGLPFQIFHLDDMSFHTLDMKTNLLDADSFAWSPDGQFISFLVVHPDLDNTSLGNGIFIIPSEGGVVTKMNVSEDVERVWFWVDID